MVPEHPWVRQTTRKGVVGQFALIQEFSDFLAIPNPLSPTRYLTKLRFSFFGGEGHTGGAIAFWFAERAGEMALLAGEVTFTVTGTTAHPKAAWSRGTLRAARRWRSRRSTGAARLKSG